MARPSKSSARPAAKNDRDARKQLKTLEKTISQLDLQKRDLNAQLLNTSNAKEALRLHNEVSAVSTQLTEAEDRWCQLQEQIESIA